MQMSSARMILRTEIGLNDPPRTVGSLARITHSVPDTTPMPVTADAPTGNSVSAAAMGESSRNGASRSRSSSIRSRTRSRPRSWWRCRYVSPPPATASATSASSASRWSSIADRLARYVSDRVSRFERMNAQRASSSVAGPRPTLRVVCEVRRLLRRCPHLGLRRCGELAEAASAGACAAIAGCCLRGSWLLRRCPHLGLRRCGELAEAASAGACAAIAGCCLRGSSAPSPLSSPRPPAMWRAGRGCFGWRLRSDCRLLSARFVGSFVAVLTSASGDRARPSERR